MEQEIYQTEYSLAKMISEGVRIFKDIWQLILIIVLAVYIPVRTVLFFTLTPEESKLGETLFSSLTGVIEGFFGIIAVMAVMYAAKSRIDNQEVGFKQCLKKSLSRTPAAIYTNIILTIFLIGLFLLFIVPGIIYSVYWSFVLYAVVLCSKSGLGALAHSKSIVQGRWWTVLWYSLVLGILSLLMYIVVGFLSFFLPAHFLFEIIAQAAADIVSMFFVVVFTIFFINFESTREEKLSE